MTTFFVMSAHHRRLVTFTFVFAQSLFWCGSAPAAIVLDEFNDPVLVTIPDSNNQWAITPEVGPLRATRRVRVFWGQGDPVGRLDVSLTTPSVMTGEVSRLNPRNALSKPIASLQFDYSLDAADFTEGGVNTAIFLDFLRIESEIAPSQFRLGINGWYYSLMPGPLSTGPLTLAIPFDATFFTRDGQQGGPDFEQVRLIEFSFRVSEWTGGGPDPLNFFMQLDRIRIGRAVPEPSTFVFGALGSCFTCLAFRRHRSSCKQGGRSYGSANYWMLTPSHGHR